MIIPRAARAPSPHACKPLFDEWHFGLDRGCTGHFEQSFVARFGILYSFFPVSLIKRVILFRDSCRAECGLAPPQLNGEPDLELSLFSTNLHDGEDKKRDDSDGTRAAQSCCREKALKSIGLGRKHGARGPGKFPTQWSSEPETNLRLTARESRGYPDKRKIRNRQFIRSTPQRQHLIRGDLFFRKQEENELISRSFTRLRY